MMAAWDAFRHEAQMLNYLRVTGSKVGVLINFGPKKDLEWRRFVY